MARGRASPNQGRDFDPISDDEPPPRDRTVGKLVGLVAQAFNQRNVGLVTRDMALMVAAGDKSEPTRETILNSVKEPTRDPKGNIKRRNRLTIVRHKFAHLALNYLDGRRAKRSKIPAQPADESAWREARKICKFVLREERDKRYARTLGTDFGNDATMEELTGVFAVCRRETKDKKYHQELLILSNTGKENAPRWQCTYIAHPSVARGEWYLIGDILYCHMSGWRDDNSHELCGLYFAYYKEHHDLLTGFLAGAGTEDKIPVAMPIVAVRISNPHPSIPNIGDLGDHALLQAFRNIGADLESVADVRKKLNAILEKQFPVDVEFKARECTRELEDAFAGGQDLILEKFAKFCKDGIKG